MPDDFPYDNRNHWLDAVNFGKARNLRLEEEKRQETMAAHARLERVMAAIEREQKAGELGVPIEVVDKLDELAPELREQAIKGIMDLLEGLQNRPKFPERAVKNPETRAEMMAEAALEAPSKEHEVRNRSVRISRQETKKVAREYLRRLYTNQDGKLFCQICQQVMPFTLADGLHYFEAVEFIDDVSREHPQNHLALCPVCAAKFQHALGTSSEDLHRDLQEELVRIHVVLAREECEIRFVDVHKMDLMALFSSEPSQTHVT